MGGGTRYTPNRLLTWRRLQRGWSYEELAAQIRRSMALAKDVDTGLSANTVRRWETGERWPEPRFRKHLVLVFGVTAADLGLLTPEEMEYRPELDAVALLRRLLDVTTGSDGIDRAAVLRGLVGLAALPGLGPLLSLGSATDQPAPSNGGATAYQQVTVQHRALYWSCPPRVLFEPVYAHAGLGVSLVRAAHGTDGQTIAAALAETAMLAGRLAFFDLDQSALAQRCYDVALAASREAEDHTLATGVLGHMAFIPAFASNNQAAQDVLTAAFQHTWHGVPPAVRAWLHCAASESHARVGEGAEARRHIDLAQTALGQDPTVPEWMDFFSQARLHAFAGYALLADHDPAAATTQLNASMTALGDQDAKQRSVVLADLADANRGDADLAADYLRRALDDLERTWYGTGLDRVRTTRTVLGDSLLGNEIDDRIAALTAVGRPAIGG